MKKEIRIPGFTGSHPQPQENLVERICEDVILRFDSGRTITYKDATHHTIVLGTTGSGKTQSVIFPALFSLYKINATGLVMDIKGSLRAYNYMLARAAGRENDLLELGTSPQATRINITRNLTPDGMRHLIEDIVMHHLKGSENNKDWTMRGIMQTSDCGILLLFLAETDPAFEPTIRLILDMIESPKLAVEMFAFFKSKVYDANNLEHRRFVNSVEGNEFHVLKKQRSGSTRNSSDEQQTWNLNSTRDALKAFLNTPGIERNFCCQGAPGVDLLPWLAENKIIVVRFELDTGPVGSMLSRMLISHFYHLIFEIGSLRKTNRKFFICIDEFQEVADLSDGRFSDTSFIGQAREFNCAVITATQSMSALVCKGQQTTAVEAFVSNCNQRVMFYSDDPLTQEMAKRYDPDMSLSELESGHAFVVTYNQATRRHDHSVESLDTAYSSTLDLTKDAASPPVTGQDTEEEKQVSIFDLLDRVHEKGHTMPQTRSNTREFVEMQALNTSIYEEYQRFFDPDADANSFSIPTGWIESVSRVFKIFSEIGMPVAISKFHFANGVLKVAASSSYARGSDMGIEIINSLLAKCGKLCVVCGARLDEPVQPDNDDDWDDDDEHEVSRRRYSIANSTYFCHDCLKRIDTLSIQHS